MSLLVVLGGLLVAGVLPAESKVTLSAIALGGDCLWYGCVPSKSLIHALPNGLPAQIIWAHPLQ